MRRRCRSRRSSRRGDIHAGNVSQSSTRGLAQKRRDPNWSDIGVFRAGLRFRPPARASGDPALIAIVRLSLIVSLSAVFVAALIGVPLGAMIALTRFTGRQVVIVLLNALMGLPPVVVGLAVYLMLSRPARLVLGAVVHAQAMVIAQTVLVASIIADSRARPSRICGSNTVTNSPQ